MTEHAHDADRTAGTEAWHRDLPADGHAPDPAADAVRDGAQPLWRRPLFHVPAGTLDPNTAQTTGMRRFEALSARHGGTEKIWLGENHVGPQMRSGDHHHGEAETGIYVISGHPVFVFLADGEEQRKAPRQVEAEAARLAGGGRVVMGRCGCHWKRASIGSSATAR